MDKKQRLEENLVNMRKLMLIKEEENIPYAEEIPDETDANVESVLEKVLAEVKADYTKAKKYIDTEASKLMVGTSLIDIINDQNIARSKEKELENTHEFFEKRNEYYDERVDEFHEKKGYNEPKIEEIQKYNHALYELARDMYDAAQVWYKLNGLVDEVREIYENNPKRRKTLIKIKSNEI